MTTRTTLRTLALATVLLALGPAVAFAAADAPGDATASGTEIVALPVAPTFTLAAGDREGGQRCSCSASANCEYGISTISCNDTSSPCNCSSVDQDCDQDITGWVKCDGSTLECEACPTSPPPLQSCSELNGGPCSNCPSQCQLDGGGTGFCHCFGGRCTCTL